MQAKSLQLLPSNLEYTYPFSNTAISKQIQKSLFDKNYQLLELELGKYPSITTTGSLNDHLTTKADLSTYSDNNGNFPLQEKLFLTTTKIKLDIFQSLVLKKSSANHKNQNQHEYEHRSSKQQNLETVSSSIEHYMNSPSRVYKMFTRKNNGSGFDVNNQNIGANLHLHPDIVKIYTLGLSFYILELVPKKETQNNLSMQLQQPSNKNGHPHNKLSQQQSQQQQQSEAIKKIRGIEQKQLLMDLMENLKPVRMYMENKQVYEMLISRRYLLFSFIELQTKKLIKNKRKENKEDVYGLMEILNGMLGSLEMGGGNDGKHYQSKDRDIEKTKNGSRFGTKKANQPSSTSSPTAATSSIPATTKQFIKKIQLILIHLRIYYLNTSINISLSEILKEYLQLIDQQLTSKSKSKTNHPSQSHFDGHDSMINYDTIIVLLYNVLKILLGVDQIVVNSSSGGSDSKNGVRQLIGNILKRFDGWLMMSSSKGKKNGKDVTVGERGMMRFDDADEMGSSTTVGEYSYAETVFRLFLIIKVLIFRKQHHHHNHQNSQSHPQTPQQQTLHTTSIQQSPSTQDPILSQTFSTFLNINLDTTIVQLNEISRNIIRYRVGSLSTIIGFKLGIQNMALNFLSLLHDSTFTNDIQTIKLCFELFENREFSKLEHLFQIVLSSGTCKNLKEREVLIAMCGIFIGIYLENRQEGLLYAKLNHQENKKFILREETLYQHIGFSYYNLAKQQIYLQNRQVYLVKALQNFHHSYNLNPINYVILYNMSKIYLQMYDYQNALKYSLECCKCNRGRWISFTLLACVYYCQKKLHKAIIIVDELLKKYHNVEEDSALLYYIRAYLEVNKILLDVEHDEEIQAAKEIVRDSCGSGSGSGGGGDVENNNDEQIYELIRERILKSKSYSGLNMYCQEFYNRSLMMGGGNGNGNIGGDDFLNNSNSGNILIMGGDGEGNGSSRSGAKLLRQSNHNQGHNFGSGSYNNNNNDHHHLRSSSTQFQPLLHPQLSTVSNNNQQTAVSNSNVDDRKILLMIVELFIEVQQLQTAENLLRTIGESQHSSESRFYKAEISLKRTTNMNELNGYYMGNGSGDSIGKNCSNSSHHRHHQNSHITNSYPTSTSPNHSLTTNPTNSANDPLSNILSQYRRILAHDNMHIDSLLKCALLERNNAEAWNYVLLVGRFINDSKYWFVRGVVLSRLGRYEEAHECFLKEGEIGWLRVLPEKLYYY